MSGPTDEYERRYMAGGEALAHTRVRMPGWFFGLMGVVLLVQLVAVVTLLGVAGAPFTAALPSLVTMPLLAVVTLLFSHLRLTVTASHVIVQYGLFGPKIPLERIVSARVATYDWKRFGGWGLKRARDGTVAYSVPGAGALCVELEYQDDNGRTRRAVVSSDDAAGIVSAIENARAARGGVRVATAGAGASGVPAEREAAAVAARDGAARERVDG